LQFPEQVGEDRTLRKQWPDIRSKVKEKQGFWM
jgi:hypothetical protein